MNNMSMKEYCVSASEKCVCIRRSEANKILHVTEGENAQLVRLRTKDNVFIAWLYDGEEETLFYPAFKVDEGKLPDITEILAADEVKPDTAFFCYRTGEYYYLFAEGEEKDEEDFKYKDISDTEIMQIVFFANERMIWQIFNQVSYPELPMQPFVRPYTLDVDGKKQVFWYIEFCAWETVKDEKSVLTSEKKFKEWSSLSKFWKPDGYQKLLNTDLTAEDVEYEARAYVECRNLPDDIKPWECVSADHRRYKDFKEFLQVNCFPDHIKRICHSHVIFIPLVWSDNKSFELRVLSDLMKQVEMARDYELFYQHLSVEDGFQFRNAVDYDTYNIFSSRAMKIGDCYYSCAWNETLGTYFNKSSKPRLYFLRDNAAKEILKIHTEMSPDDSSEDRSFKIYLKWNDKEWVDKNYDKTCKQRYAIH